MNDHDAGADGSPPSDAPLACDALVCDDFEASHFASAWSVNSSHDELSLGTHPYAGAQSAHFHIVPTRNGHDSLTYTLPKGSVIELSLAYFPAPTIGSNDDHINVFGLNLPDAPFAPNASEVITQ